MTTLHPMPDGVAPVAIDIAEARNKVPGAYEDTVPQLDGDKLLIKERLDAGGRPVSSFDDTRRTALAFLANPCNLWNTERLEDRCAVLRLTFAI